MLTRTTRPKVLLALAAIITLMLATLITAANVATAEEDEDCNEAGNGRIDYCDGDDGDDEDGDDDDDGVGGEPTCDLSIIDDYSGYDFDSGRWCEGELACYEKVPPDFPPGEDDLAEKPSDDAIWKFETCLDPDGNVTRAGWLWEEPDGPTQEELAWEAFGNLAAPEFELVFNPPQRSYVELDTWWWAEGAPEGEIVGLPAGGMVAIGTPRHIEVTPGDGSGMFTCQPIATTQTPDCSHRYAKASVNGQATGSDGQPAYLAEAVLVYDVRFEFNGEEIPIPPGLPDPLTLESSEPETAAVVVAEIQGIVTE
jgi:hypothetical protein